MSPDKPGNRLPPGKPGIRPHSGRPGNRLFTQSGNRLSPDKPGNRLHNGKPGIRLPPGKSGIGMAPWHMTGTGTGGVERRWSDTRRGGKSGIWGGVKGRGGEGEVGWRWPETGTIDFFPILWQRCTETLKICGDIEGDAWT